MTRTSRRTRACAAAGALLVTLGAPGFAATEDRVAGRLNGEPIPLSEVDAALGGTFQQSWRTIDAIVRESARAICAARAEERIAGEAQLDVAAWRAARWQAAEPSPQDVEAFLADAPELPKETPSGPFARHAAWVRAYRASIAAPIDARLEQAYTLHLPPAPTAPSGETPIPERIASCFGEDITPTQVERFASFPLFRRRADVVATACRQFEIDHSNPLVLHRLASAKGMTVDQLMRSVEGEPVEPAPERIEAIASERYGQVDEVARSKVRFALDASRRVEARMKFLEQVRSGTEGECALATPEPPIADLPHPSASEDGLRVVYFGNFSCTHCTSGLRTLDDVRKRHGDRVYLEFRHHFPATLAPAFEDALDAECSARQGRFWQYASWRAQRPDGTPLDDAALGLDAAAASRCRANPATAVKILADTDEALRMGFRDAVPSWVIGRRPRRGTQGPKILDETIEAELAHRSTRQQP